MDNDKTLNNLKDKILNNVSEYIKLKNKSKKWKPGIDFVHYAGPVFDENEYISAIDTILNGWLILDNKGLEFERKFAEQLGKKYGIFVNSGSSANLLMLSSVSSKFTPKTKIITPVSGFPTTINPIIQLGFKPVFVDIELDTLNIDLDKLEELLREELLIPEYRRSKAIMLAHVLGNPTDMGRLMDICEKYKLIFLEDCCDALGSKWGGKKLGSFGEISTCSFYPAHHMTTGEGGFVATNHLSVYKKLRSLRDWGRACFCSTKEQSISKDGACMHRFDNWLEDKPDLIVDHKYVFREIGYNLKPIELQAAWGLEQIKKLEMMKQKRKRNYRNLYNIFSQYEEFFILPKPQGGGIANVNWFAFPLTIRNNKILSRNDIIQYFEDHRIQTRPYFSGNILEHPGYKHIKDDEKYPNADKVLEDTFFIGTSPVITNEQIEYIGKIFNDFMKEYVWI